METIKLKYILWATWFMLTCLGFITAYKVNKEEDKTVLKKHETKYMTAKELKDWVPSYESNWRDRYYK